jgi:DNA polymerase-3 subunit delta'
MAAAILGGALQSGRVAHAYIFCGPKGTGKLACALDFAAALNCQRDGFERFQQGVCECDSCRRTQAVVHPDIRLLQPAGAKIKIDQIRYLIKELWQRPFAGKYKIHILDQADRCNVESANSILKILEDPPGQAVIILVTDKPSTLPATVRSRCQFVRFVNLPIEEQGRRLQSKYGLAADRAKLIATLGEGNPGRSEELVANAQLDRYRKLAQTVVTGLGGRNDWELFALVKELEMEKDGLRDILHLVCALLRDLVCLSATDQGVDLINCDKERELALAARGIPLGKWYQAFSLVQEVEADLERNINKRLLLEGLVFNLHTLLATDGTSSAFDR